ncbi:MAG: helix-turn-helix transcriptional regulator [Actinomycetota bacterium]
MPRSSGTPASERLRRLLLVVPYVVQHPGTSLDELTELFDVSRKDLLADLNLLFLAGLPPYGPGDLMNVDIDEEGGVWIDMADYFAKPLRLSRNEALALYLRGKELIGAPGLPEAEPLRSALAKLEERLGPDMLAGAGGLVEATEGGGPSETLEGLRDAAAQHHRLEIEYYSASRDETSVRRIDPEEVFSAIGNWYAVAWDDGAEGERMFRVDRIRALRETGEPFEPRGLAGAGRPLYSRSQEDVPVRLRLRPGARWVAEYYLVEDVVERGGDLEVTLPTRQLAWVGKLLLRLGGEAAVLDPPELRELLQGTARETLARYR